MQLSAISLAITRLGGAPALPALPAWTPASTTTALWLDAADATKVTVVSGRVSSWVDKSGNARNATQATVALRPLYNTTALNSKPSVVFDSTDDFLTYNGAFLANTDYTVLAVVYRNDPETNAWFMGGQTAGVNANLQLGWDGPNDKFRFSQYTNDVDTLGITYTSGQGLIAVARQAAATGKSTFFNGTAGTASAHAVPLTAYTGSAIGRWFTNYFGGGVSEVVITTTALSVPDRQKLEGYLAWKWALEANLPVGHPYKISPPTTADNAWIFNAPERSGHLLTSGLM
jgi:hypothetical protein